MSVYIVYDGTGTIVKSLHISAPADQIAALVAANAGAGNATLPVDSDSPAILNPNGWQVVNGALLPIVPTSAQVLAAAQTAQTAIVAAAYQQAITAACPYMGTSFWCDKDSQTILAHSLVVFNQAGALPPNFYYLDASGNEVAMTLAQLQGLGAAVAAQYLGAFQKRVSLQKQIAAATTVAEVQAVAW